MTKRTLSFIHARQGNSRAYRSVQGDHPRVDAVELLAKPGWLKGGDLAVGELTPKQARLLAIQLLDAAESIEDRAAESIEDRT